MRYFGISGVRHLQGIDEIEGYRVHSINQEAKDFVHEDWELWKPSEVKTAIDRGHHVFIIRFDSDDNCERGYNVIARKDQEGSLFTPIEGRTWDTLGQLPSF